VNFRLEQAARDPASRRGRTGRTRTAIGELSTLPGVGRLTSEWVLLRGLRRFEIVPAGDLAVRKAVAWALRSPEALTEQQVRDATSGWSPYGGLIAYRLLVAHRQAIG